MEVGDVQGPVGNDRQGVQVNSVGPLSPLLCNNKNMIKIAPIFSQVSMHSHTTLWFLGNFSCFCCRLLAFFKINFFKKFFYKHYQSVKRFGSRSGPTMCRS